MVLKIGRKLLRIEIVEEIAAICGRLKLYTAMGLQLAVTSDPAKRPPVRRAESEVLTEKAPTQNIAPKSRHVSPYLSGCPAELRNVQWHPWARKRPHWALQRERESLHVGDRLLLHSGPVESVTAWRSFETDL